MSKKLTIVIQGPTRSLSITRQICEAASSFKHRVIYSTHDTEPEDCLAHIRQVENIELVLSKKPVNRGDGNLRLQLATTLAGLEQCHFDDICLKIRSDIILVNPDLLFDELMQIDFTQYPIVSSWVIDKVAYIGDYICAGKKLDMLDFFKLEGSEKFRKEGRAELFLQNRFLGRTSEDFIWDSVLANEPQFVDRLKQFVQTSPQAGACHDLKYKRTLTPFVHPVKGIVV